MERRAPGVLARGTPKRFALALAEMEQAPCPERARAGPRGRSAAARAELSLVQTPRAAAGTRVVGSSRPLPSLSGSSKLAWRGTRRGFRLLIRGVARAELTTLVLVVLGALGSWLFLEIVDEVTEGETLAIDQRILLALRNPHDATDPLGPGWVEEFVRDVTAFGGMGAVTITTLVVAAYLYLRRDPRLALMLVVSVGTGLAASTLMKSYFDRPRPDLVPHGSIVYSESFPSGHSMLSAVAYLTIGALLARVQPQRRLSLFVLGVALCLTLAVGFSRVYLGVHWPTDVVAGWSAGAVWASACWLVARRLQVIGKIERSPSAAVTPEGVRPEARDADS